MAATTKTDTQCRSWMFTLNNPQPEEDPKTWGYHFLAYQLEKGADGTIHYQGYITFKVPKRFSTMKKLNPRAHWSMRKGTHDQALAYVTKEDTRQEGPWVLGNKPHPGKRTDLDKLKDDLDAGLSMGEIAQVHFGQYLRFHSAIDKYRVLQISDRTEPPIVTVHYGPPGVGKSTAVQDTLRSLGMTFYVKDPKSDWWEGYENQDAVILEEFSGRIPYSFLKLLCDTTPSPLSVEVKNGHRKFTSKFIHIVSNHSPTDWYAEKHNYLELHRRIKVCLFYSDLGVPPTDEFNHEEEQFHCHYPGCPARRIIEKFSGKRIAPEPLPTHSPSGRPLTEYDDALYQELDSQNQSKRQRL